MSDELKDFFAELQSREIIADHANLNNFCQLKPNERVIYWGVDCTGESLHIGHLFLLIQTIRFAKEGFQILLVLGGATSKIGDPSDKLKERPQLAAEKLSQYYQKIKKQLTQMVVRPSIAETVKRVEFSPLSKQTYGYDSKLLNNIYKILRIDNEDNNEKKWEKYLSYIWPLHENKYEILDNQQWLEKLSFTDFIDQAGRNITINYLLAKETIKQRVNSKTGLSYLAFSYSLLQAYDFYYLYKNYNCHGQIGGSDQWGNLTTGLKLIHSIYPENKAFAFTFSLLTDKDGKKISKSSAGKTIWLSLEKTSFHELYDFLRNMPDEQTLKFLSQLSFLTKEQIEKINQLNNPRKLRIPQRILTELLFYFLYGETGLIRLKEFT